MVFWPGASARGRVFGDGDHKQPRGLVLRATLLPSPLFQFFPLRPMLLRCRCASSIPTHMHAEDRCVAGLYVLLLSRYIFSCYQSRYSCFLATRRLSDPGMFPERPR